MTLLLLDTLQPVARSSMRATLEATMIARLEPLAIRAGGYVRKIDHYNGEIDGARSPDDVKRELLGQAPAILVSSSTSSELERSARRVRLEETMQIELLVVSAHGSSRDARLLGAVGPAGADPGVYKMLEDARKLLHMRHLGLPGVRRPRHQSDSIVTQLADFTAWRSLYTVRVSNFEQPSVFGPPAEVVETHHNADPADLANPVITVETRP